MTRMDTFGFSASRPATTLPAVPPKLLVRFFDLSQRALTSYDDEVILLFDFGTNRSHFEVLFEVVVGFGFGSFYERVLSGSFFLVQAWLLL